MRRPEIPFVDELFAVGEGSPSVQRRVDLAQTIREQSPDLSRHLDAMLLERLVVWGRGLHEARTSQKKLKEVLEKMSAPPWLTAVFSKTVPTPAGLRALVLMGGSRHVVGLADGVEPDSLVAGDEVFLNREMVLMERSPYGMPSCGDIAVFDRYQPDGRLVVRSRDDETVVEASGALQETGLKSGEAVRWSREKGMAFEKIERSNGTQLFLDEAPTETFDHVGGLDRQIESLKRTLQLHMEHADTVHKYQLPRKRSALLVGPPGTGKTMLARALANWVGSLSKSGRARFMNIKPLSLHSMWYAQSEANYREAFRAGKQAGEQDPDCPVFMFFDEVDAVGASRGDALMRIDDRVLTAFMAELDGLEDRGNIFVLAASNRREAIDPALLRPGRLGDLIIDVPRPGRQAARHIFEKHLSLDIPYAENGHGSDKAANRAAIIESCLSTIYSPNGDGELATITFRDGKKRAVRGSDMINGAVIAKIAQAAAERACVREIETGQSGVQMQDVVVSAAEELECAVRGLTRANCRKYLSDLPQDVDVVSVEPRQRPVSRPHEYLNLNAG